MVVRTVVSELEDVAEKEKHVKKVPTVNRYKKSFFQIPKEKVKEEYKETEGPTANKHQVSIIIISGLSEQLQWVIKSHGILLPQTFQYHKVTVG